MNKRGLSFWDILAWIALGLILVWIILKTLGVINTSLWLEYTPIYAAVYIAGWQIHKLEIVAREVEGLKKFKDATINEINNIKTNCKINHKTKR